MNLLRAALAASLLALIVSGGCGREERKESGTNATSGEIVRVGDVVLTAEELEILSGGEGVYSADFEERRSFVKRWVDMQVLYQEALKRGLDELPEIKARLRELKMQVLADYLVFLELRERARVSEQEIEAYFAAHELEYRNEYRVSQILVSTREEAERAMELLSKKSFEAVARLMSLGETSRRGGDLGYLTKGNMIPELEAIIFSMKPGETSDIIESPAGYHIFKLVDVREGSVAVGYEEVREQIMNELMLEKRERAYRSLLDSLRAKTKILYRDPTYERGLPIQPIQDTLDIGSPLDSSVVP